MKLTKQCPGCLRKLPYTTANFRQRSGRPAGQLTSRCRRCNAMTSKAWHALHPTYGREYRRANVPRRIAYHLKQAEKLIRQLGSTNITETT